MRLLVADDHNLVRDALVGLLSLAEPGIELFSACDLPTALREMRENSPIDLVLLDLRMPGMNGLGGLRQFIEAYPEVKVILMSGAASSIDIQSAFDIGISGFIPKTMNGNALINAIRLVLGGEKYRPFESHHDGQSPQIGNVPKLTDREKQVLGELRQGNSNKEIARTLGISEATVKLHIRTLGDKLSARNRTDIVIRAIDRNLA